MPMKNAARMPQSLSAWWVPAVYVGTDGKLYASYWPGQIVSPGVVNNGAWHHFALTVEERYAA